MPPFLPELGREGKIAEWRDIKMSTKRWRARLMIDTRTNKCQNIPTCFFLILHYDIPELFLLSPYRSSSSFSLPVRIFALFRIRHTRGINDGKRSKSTCELSWRLQFSVRFCIYISSILENSWKCAGVLHIKSWIFMIFRYYFNKLKNIYVWINKYTMNYNSPHVKCIYFSMNIKK